MSIAKITGRSSSHFTRVALVFAHELGVPYELISVPDLTVIDASSYSDHPAMKIPSMELGDLRVFGSENICRTLAEHARIERRTVWPEEVRVAVARNAQEMTWQAMTAEVQLILGAIHRLPLDNGYFAKIKAGFEGSLAWLDAHLEPALQAFPPERDLSLLEVTLFCLIEHITFRGVLPLEPYPALVGFAAGFAERASAKSTPYQFHHR